MKTTFINRNSGLFARSGIVAAAAVVCGYWASQIIATNVVSDAEMGKSSFLAGALCFGIFGILFVLHLFRPWSKGAAILGLCSLAVFTGVMGYYIAPWLPIVRPISKYVPSVNTALLITTILGVTGVMLDANRCWRVSRTHAQGCDISDDFVI